MTFERLISICQQARTEFQKAAAAAEDETLKRLLNLYAQQRTRFARELLQELHPEEFTASCYDPEGDEAEACSRGGDAELLKQCLRNDSRMLESYRDALGARIPTRAHFLVSAQYALMQKAHERIQGMLAATELPPVPRFAVCQAAS